MVESLKASLALWTTPDMLWFSFTLFYTGLHLTLWDGLFSTCIGFTGGSVILPLPTPIPPRPKFSPRKTLLVFR